MSNLVCADPAALAEAAADWMVKRLATTPGRLAVSLSGGSTPRLLYETLARAPWRDVMPWARVHWFWGDERFVAPEDPASNLGMVRRAMLDHVPVPADHVHAIPTTGMTPEQAALAYEATLRGFDGDDLTRPLFDLVLLGLGTNGHTASLFPGEAIVQERKAWAAPVTPPGEPTRISLTWPPLESCRTAAFLVAGADKRAVVARVRRHDPALVASAYHPAGELLWWLDVGAAG